MTLVFGKSRRCTEAMVLEAMGRDGFRGCIATAHPSAVMYRILQLVPGVRLDGETVRFANGSEIRVLGVGY